MSFIFSSFNENENDGSNSPRPNQMCNSKYSTEYDTNPSHNYISNPMNGSSLPWRPCRDEDGLRSAIFGDRKVYILVSDACKERKERKERERGKKGWIKQGKGNDKERNKNQRTDTYNHRYPIDRYQKPWPWVSFLLESLLKVGRPAVLSQTMNASSSLKIRYRVVIGVAIRVLIAPVWWGTTCHWVYFVCWMSIITSQAIPLSVISSCRYL